MVKVKNGFFYCNVRKPPNLFFSLKETNKDIFLKSSLNHFKQKEKLSFYCKNKLRDFNSIGMHLVPYSLSNSIQINCPRLFHVKFKRWIVENHPPSPPLWISFCPRACLINHIGESVQAHNKTSSWKQSPLDLNNNSWETNHVKYIIELISRQLVMHRGAKCSLEKRQEKEKKKTSLRKQIKAPKVFKACGGIATLSSSNYESNDDLKKPQQLRSRALFREEKTRSFILSAEAEGIKFQNPSKNAPEVSFPFSQVQICLDCRVVKDRPNF